MFPCLCRAHQHFKGFLTQWYKLWIMGGTNPWLHISRINPAPYRSCILKNDTSCWAAIEWAQEHSSSLTAPWVPTRCTPTLRNFCVTPFLPLGWVCSTSHHITRMEQAPRDEQIWKVKEIKTTKFREFHRDLNNEIMGSGDFGSTFFWWQMGGQILFAHWKDGALSTVII